MAAASGTTRVESADENREIHVNGFKVLTDPYVLDTPNFNNELVAQYPRFIQLVPTAAVVPNAGTLAFSILDWGANPTVSRSTFTGTINGVSKIPQITNVSEINSVAGQTTSLYVPKGGYWEFNAYFIFNNPLNTVDTTVVVGIDYSTNSGGAFNRVATNNAAQSNPIGPTVIGLTVSWTNYFTENNFGTVERFRLVVATNQPMAAGVTCNLNCIRLR